MAGVLLLQGRAAFAQTTFYNPVTSGSWNVGSTWNTGAVPPNAPASTYVIGMGGRTISIGGGDTISIRGIELGHGSHAGGGAGILTMSGGSFQSATNFTVGSSDAGTFTQTGGSVTAASVDLGTFYARAAGRTSATWTMSSTAALTVTGTMRVGPNTQSNQFAGGLNSTFTQGGTTTVSIGGDILIGATMNPSTAITNVYNLDGGTLTLSGTIGSPGTQANSTNNFVFNGGTLVYNGASDRTNFLQGLSNAFVKAGGVSIDTGGRSLTIAQPLLTDTTSTGGGFTKLGSGTLALAGANTYTGTTTASAGTIGINNNLALQNSVLDTASAGAFLLGSGSITTPTFGGLVGGTDLATELGNYAQVTALTLNPASGRTVTYSGTIANGAASMALTKTGSGTQILTAANTYTGTTSISAGTLQIGGGGTTGALATSSAITGSAGATLAFSRTDTVTQGSEFASVIGGAINVSQLGSGTLVLDGANTHSGTTTAAAGTIAITNNLALQNSVLDTAGAGGLVLGSGSITTPTIGGLTGATDLATELGNYAQVTALTLNPAAGRTVTYSGAISDGAAGTTITKTGAGTQILAGTTPTPAPPP